jgi:hypothetical protein
MAEAKFPFSSFPVGDLKRHQKMTQDRHAYYTSQRERAIGFVAGKYQLSREALEAVQRLSAEKKWIPSATPVLFNPAEYRAKLAKDQERVKANRKLAAMMAVARNLEKSKKLTAAIANYRAVTKDFAGTKEAKEAESRIRALEQAK